jgi:mycothiol S-conjugate amidase
MRLTAIHERMQELRGTSPFDDSWFERPDLDGAITTRIDVREFIWARSQALLSHRTQIDPKEMFWFGLSDDELAETYPFEDWIRARSLVEVQANGRFEDDFFNGIPQAG